MAGRSTNPCGDRGFQKFQLSLERQSGGRGSCRAARFGIKPRLTGRPALSATAPPTGRALVHPQASLAVAPRVIPGSDGRRGNGFIYRSLTNGEAPATRRSPRCSPHAPPCLSMRMQISLVVTDLRIYDEDRRQLVIQRDSLCLPFCADCIIIAGLTRENR